MFYQLFWVLIIDLLVILLCILIEYIDVIFNSCNIDHDSNEHDIQLYISEIKRCKYWEQFDGNGTLLMHTILNNLISIYIFIRIFLFFYFAKNNVKIRITITAFILNSFLYLFIGRLGFYRDFFLLGNCPHNNSFKITNPPEELKESVNKFEKNICIFLPFYFFITWLITWLISLF